MKRVRALSLRSFKSKKKVFGAVLNAYTGEVPPIVQRCIKYLEAFTQDEGLFRVTGGITEVQGIKQLCDHGVDPDIEKQTNPNNVASLLKLYLREMPEPLFPFKTYTPLLNTAEVKDDKERLEQTKGIVNGMPPTHYALGKAVFGLLNKVCASSTVNGMTPRNMATVFAGNMLRGEDESIQSIVKDTQTVISVVQFILENYAIVFQNELVVNVAAAASPALSSTQHLAAGPLASSLPAPLVARSSPLEILPSAAAAAAPQPVSSPRSSEASPSVTNAAASASAPTTTTVPPAPTAKVEVHLSPPKQSTSALPLSSDSSSSESEEDILERHSPAVLSPAPMLSKSGGGASAAQGSSASLSSSAGGNLRLPPAHRIAASTSGAFATGGSARAASPLSASCEDGDVDPEETSAKVCARMEELGLTPEQRGVLANELAGLVRALRAEAKRDVKRATCQFSEDLKITLAEMAAEQAKNQTVPLADLAKVKAERDEALAKLAALQTKVTGLETFKSKAEQELVTLQDSLESEKNFCEQSCKAEREALGHLEAAKTEISSLKIKIAELSEKPPVVVPSISPGVVRRAEEEVESLRQSLQQAKQELSAKSQEISALKERLEQADEMKAKFQELRDSLTRTLKTVEESGAKNESEGRIHTEELARVASENTSLRAELDQMKTDMEETMVVIDRNAKDTQLAERELQRARQEIIALRRSIPEAEPPTQQQATPCKCSPPSMPDAKRYLELYENALSEKDKLSVKYHTWHAHAEILRSLLMRTDRALKELRWRHFFSLALCIRKHSLPYQEAEELEDKLPTKTIAEEGIEVGDLYDKAEALAIPVADWPCWIADNTSL